MAAVSKDNGANVQLWDNNGVTGQIWKFIEESEGVYRIKNAYSNKYLSLDSSHKNEEGCNVLQLSSNGRDDQLWRAEVYNNKLMFINVHSNYVLDCYGGYADNGTNIQVWSRNNSKAQLFELRPETIKTKGTRSITVGNVSVTEHAYDNGDRYYEVPEEMYVIQSCSGSNQVLDVYGGGKDNGVNVISWADNNGNGQKWQFVRTGNGIYKIMSVVSGKCLEVAGQDSNTNGGNVQQWDYENGWSNKLWKLWLTKDKKLVFLNTASYRALNITGGTATNGANVTVQDRNRSANQSWTLKRTSKQIDPNEECRSMENEIWTAYCNYRRSKGFSIPVRDSYMEALAHQSAQHCADVGKLEHTMRKQYHIYSDILQYATYRMTGDDAVTKWKNHKEHRIMMNCRTVTKAGVGVVNKNGTYYMAIVYDFTGTNVGDD